MVRYRVAIFLLFAQLLMVWAVNSQAKEACDYEGALQDLGKNFESARNSADYFEKRTSLLKSIKFWQESMGHQVSEVQSRRQNLVNLLEMFLRFERPFVIVDSLKPNYSEFFLGYYRLQKNIVIVADVKSVRKMIVDAGASIDWSAVERAVKSSTFYSGTDFTEALRNQDAKGFLSALDSKVKEFERSNEDIAKMIARKYDAYESSYTYLKKIAEGGAGISDQRRLSAETALDKLQPKYLIGDLANDPKLETQAFIDAQNEALKDIAYPSLAAIHQTLNHYPSAELAKLAYYNRIEFFNWMLNKVDDDTLFTILGHAAARIPWINQSELKNFFLAVRSDLNIKRYFDPIQSVVNVVSKEKEDQYLLLKSVNAGTGNNLLVTFARRADTFDIWKGIKEVAGEKGDQVFLDEMLQAEKDAKIYGTISLWRRTENSNRAAAALVNLVALSAGGYYFGSQFITNGTVVTKPVTQTPGQGSPTDFSGDTLNDKKFVDRMVSMAADSVNAENRFSPFQRGPKKKHTN